jgi:hypothetical protein
VYLNCVHQQQNHNDQALYALKIIKIIIVHDCTSSLACTQTVCLAHTETTGTINWRSPSCLPRYSRQQAVICLVGLVGFRQRRRQDASIEWFLTRSVGLGYRAASSPTFHNICAEADDERLFRKVASNSRHLLTLRCFHLHVTITMISETVLIILLFLLGPMRRSIATLLRECFTRTWTTVHIVRTTDRMCCT